MVDLKRNGFDFPWEFPTWWIFKEENPFESGGFTGKSNQCPQISFSKSWKHGPMHLLFGKAIALPQLWILKSLDKGDSG
jgi:hypothetical protein